MNDNGAGRQRSTTRASCGLDGGEAAEAASEAAFEGTQTRGSAGVASSGKGVLMAEVAFTVLLVASAFWLNWLRIKIPADEIDPAFYGLTTFFLLTLSLAAHLCWMRLYALLSNWRPGHTETDLRDLQEIKSALVRMDLQRRRAVPHARECRLRLNRFESAKQVAVREVVQDRDLERAVTLATKKLMGR